MATFSATGKRLGRPPKAAAAAPTMSDQDTALAAALLRTFQNKYDGAGRGRRMASWDAPSSGPNAAIDTGLQTLRNRSSDAVRNDWSGESIVTKWVTNLIGIAITPRFRRIKNKGRRDRVNNLFADFVREADADCILNLFGMQTLITRSWLERGEAFARRRYRRASDGLAVPMQVQLLEAEMVPNFNADQFKGMSAANKIRSGFEYDPRGKRVAFWVYKEHPNDNPGTIGSAPSADLLVRIPAEDMVHLFEPKRIGQRRGVSILAPILARLRNINDYEDVTLERQKIANLFVAFIRRTLPNLDPTDPNHAMLSGMVAELDAEGSPLVPMRPGLLQELDDGQEVTFANPPDPSTTYSDYMRTSHLGTAAGGGVPYELMSGDIAGVSDRALRVVINEFRRFNEQRQWQIIIPMFCERVIRWFAEAALLSGAIDADEFDDVVRAEHAPHGWAYIHPVQDVQGKALEVKNGFKSRSGVIGAHGDDPDAIDAERAEDAARERALGLPVTGMAEGAAQTGADQDADADAIDNEEYSQTPNPAGDGVRAELSHLRRLEARNDARRALNRTV